MRVLDGAVLEWDFRGGARVWLDEWLSVGWMNGWGLGWREEGEETARVWRGWVEPRSEKDWRMAVRAWVRFTYKRYATDGTVQYVLGHGTLRTV